MAAGGLYKSCPECRTPAALDARLCPHCGHQFRTTYVPPPTQPVMQGCQAPPVAPRPVYQPPPVPFYPQPYGTSGYRQSDIIQLPPETHSIAAAVLLSLFGLSFGGQLYNRQYRKAILSAMAAMACGVLTGGFSLLVTYPAFIIDSALIAGRLHRGEAVRQWQWF